MRCASRPRETFAPDDPRPRFCAYLRTPLAVELHARQAAAGGPALPTALLRALAMNPGARAFVHMRAAADGLPAAAWFARVLCAHDLSAGAPRSLERAAAALPLVLSARWQLELLREAAPAMLRMLCANNRVWHASAAALLLSEESVQAMTYLPAPWRDALDRVIVPACFSRRSRHGCAMRSESRLEALQELTRRPYAGAQAFVREQVRPPDGPWWPELRLLARARGAPDPCADEGPEGDAARAALLARLCPPAEPEPAALAAAQLCVAQAELRALLAGAEDPRVGRALARDAPSLPALLAALRPCVADAPVWTRALRLLLERAPCEDPRDEAALWDFAACLSAFAADPGREDGRAARRCAARFAAERAPRDSALLGLLALARDAPLAGLTSAQLARLLTENPHVFALDYAEMRERERGRRFDLWLRALQMRRGALP